MNTNKRLQILHILSKSININNSFLIYNSPFELLISLLLSCKSKDSSVNQVTSKLYKIANTPEKILSLDINIIKEYIKTLGLFNKKAKYLKEICYIIVNQYKGNIPKNFYLLKSLPGIGNKIANVFLNNALGLPTIAVDSHVFRVCNRTKFALGKTVNAVEHKLIKVVPKKFKLNIHYLLIFHGKNTCISKNPKCNNCIIKNLCEYEKISYI